MKNSALISKLSLVAAFCMAPALLQAQTDTRAQMVSPTPGSTLPGSTVTFTWTAAPHDYFLRIGTQPFGTDIFNAVVKVTSVTLVNIPTNGGAIYVDLFTNSPGKVWLDPFHYTYTAAGKPTLAQTSVTVDNKTVSFSNDPQSVTLTASVAAPAAVNQGAITFQVMDGSNPVGASVDSGPLSGNSASASYVLPGGTSAKSYTVQASYSGGSSFLASSGAGTLTVSLAAPPVTLAAVTNSASYGASSIAPGEIVSLFGAGMGPARIAFSSLDAGNRFPTSTAATRVLFNGIPAPVVFTSDKQAAAVVPFELAGQASARVVVEYNGVASAPATVAVSNTMPGIFAADGSGSGQGAIQNADQSYNSAANPAAPGSIIVLYVTGLGQINPVPPNGSLVSDPLPALSYAPAVTIAGRQATLVYAGAAPSSIAGLYQINCIVPEGVAPGPAPVVVTADGRQSQSGLTVAIR